MPRIAPLLLPVLLLVGAPVAGGQETAGSQQLAPLTAMQITGPRDDLVKAVATDSEGNVYIAVRTRAS